MLSRRSKSAKFILTVLLLSLSLWTVLLLLKTCSITEDQRFSAFTETLFKEEVSGNTLTLHYSLAYPEKQGISPGKVSLGTADPDMEQRCKIWENYEKKLNSFDASRLSPDNQITLDTLLLYFHTQLQLKNTSLLEEPLGPSLGIQAQLPVLLAEYAFYQDRDITDYLNLLHCVKPYFDSILSFEQKKSSAGYFMSDETLDRILQQCQAFIKDPQKNYLLEIFQQKLQDYGAFSPAEQKKLCAAHRRLVTEQVIPAYQNLMTGLKALRGTGKNSGGLAHFKGGQQYYKYLLQSEAGVYDPVPRLEQRLSSRLEEDSRKISNLAHQHPALTAKFLQGCDLPSMEPESMMQTLETQMKEDFPVLENTSYEIRYVHSSMEQYLSPAFYLTPPLDTCTPNMIYINRAGHRSQLDLFTTLAHEGFPGHLYQTVFFQRENPAPIRTLIAPGGYVEGWATYVESYGCRYATDLLKDEDASALTQLAWLNRDINLCIYSLLDIGIHYDGWSQTQAAEFLRRFGVKNPSAAANVYRYIAETPGNYLKYYVGCLNFLDLRREQRELLGENFDLKEFHRKILKIGPVPFPVLKKYM